MKSNESQSIQQLLVAEKRAEERIQQARKRKATRLKEAKDEAHAEIQKYKDEKEEDFINSLKKYTGSQEENTEKIQEVAAQDIVDMEKLVEKNKGEIIEKLIDEVFTIHCKVHQNFDANSYF